MLAGGTKSRCVLGSKLDDFVPDGSITFRKLEETVLFVECALVLSKTQKLRASKETNKVF